MTVFDTSIDTLFSDENLAVDATYTPAAGGPVSVRAIVEHNVDLVSAGLADITDRRIVIGVRKSDVSSPGRGDTILIGATTYTVDVVLDDDGIVSELSVQ